MSELDAMTLVPVRPVRGARTSQAARLARSSSTAIRAEVDAWRCRGLPGCLSPTRRDGCSNIGSSTSTRTPIPGTPFRYYFAQREAVETVIYLYEVAHAPAAFPEPLVGRYATVPVAAAGQPLIPAVRHQDGHRVGQDRSHGARHGLVIPAPAVRARLGPRGHSSSLPRTSSCSSASQVSRAVASSTTCRSCLPSGAASGSWT